MPSFPKVNPSGFSRRRNWINDPEKCHLPQGRLNIRATVMKTFANIVVRQAHEKQKDHPGMILGTCF